MKSLPLRMSMLSKSIAKAQLQVLPSKRTPQKILMCQSEKLMWFLCKFLVKLKMLMNLEFSKMQLPNPDEIGCQCYQNHCLRRNQKYFRLNEISMCQSEKCDFCVMFLTKLMFMNKAENTCCFLTTQTGSLFFTILIFKLAILTFLGRPMRQKSFQVWKEIYFSIW